MPNAKECTNLVILDFSGSHFIFVTTSISDTPPSFSVIAWKLLVPKKRDFDQNLVRIVVFSVPVLHIFLLVTFIGNRIFVHIKQNV